MHNIIKHLISGCTAGIATAALTLLSDDPVSGVWMLLYFSFTYALIMPADFHNIEDNSWFNWKRKKTTSDFRVFRYQQSKVKKSRDLATKNTSRNPPDVKVPKVFLSNYGFVYTSPLGVVVIVIYDPERKIDSNSLSTSLDNSFDKFVEIDAPSDNDIVEFVMRAYGWSLNNAMLKYISDNAFYQEKQYAETIFQASNEFDDKHRGEEENYLWFKYAHISNCIIHKTNEFVKTTIRGRKIRDVIDEVELCNPDAPKFTSISDDKRIGKLELFLNKTKYRVMSKNINAHDFLNRTNIKKYFEYVHRNN